MTTTSLGRRVLNDRFPKEVVRVLRGAANRSRASFGDSHDLRHTFGTIAVRVWPVPEVQLYIGDDDIKTTMRYVHYQPRHEAAQEFTATVRKMASVEVGREVGRELPTSSTA